MKTEPKRSKAGVPNDRHWYGCAHGSTFRRRYGRNQHKSATPDVGISDGNIQRKRKDNMKSFSKVAALFLFVLLTNAQGQTYTVIDLGDLGGGSSYAQAINNSGQVVGYGSTTTNGGTTHAFLYKNGVMQDLILNDESCAYGINSIGQIVGFIDPQPITIIGERDVGEVYSFLYQNPSVQYISGLNNTFAYGINNVGQVVGYVDNYQAFLYQNGAIQYLGTLAGGSHSWAYAINNSGQLVGGSATPNLGCAFLYQNGSMQNLRTLGARGYYYDSACGINNGGKVVGSSFGNSSVQHAFLYQQGLMRDLNKLVITESFS